MRVLRVAVVHSFYGSTFSGENAAVVAQVDALRRAGHHVRLLAARTEELESGRFYRLRAGLRVASGRGTSPLEAIRAFEPDVVHIHNLFPNLSTSWLQTVDAFVVATVHNYRPMCAPGTLFRDGQICTLCADGRPSPGVRYGCYHDSRLATIPVALGNRGGVPANAVLARADRVILLSPLQRSIFVRAGLPESKTVVIPNFVPRDVDPGNEASTAHDRRGWLAVGRLSPEKGILELVRGWPKGVPLTVVGDGPLQDEIRAACTTPDRVLLPTMARGEVVRQMTRHAGLAVPSRWFEACPLVYVEALAAGLPVLAWEPSGVAEFVRTDGTGLALPSGTGPSSTVTEAQPWDRLAGSTVRRVFEAKYTEAAFVRDFLALVT